MDEQSQHVNRQDTVIIDGVVYDVVEAGIKNRHGNLCDFRVVPRGTSQEPVLMGGFDDKILVIPPWESLPEKLRELEAAQDPEGRQLRVLKKPHNGSDFRYEFQHVGCTGKLFIRCFTEESADLTFETEGSDGWLSEGKPGIEDGEMEIVCPDCKTDFREFLEKHLGELQRYC